MNLTICNQIMMNLSVIVTSLPFLHRVLAGLHTGTLDTVMITDQLELSRYGGFGYVITPRSDICPPAVNASNHPKSKNRKYRQESARMNSMIALPSPVADTRSITAHDPHIVRSRTVVMHQEAGTESMEHLTMGAEDGIMQTVEVKVESEIWRSGY